MNDNFDELSKKITKSIDKKTKKNNGIFFTPIDIITEIYNKIKSNKNMLDILDILEPSCGSCQFINYFDKKYNNVNITGIEYNNIEKGIQGGLFYNVQGKTLQVVGDGFYPDVYTMPFNSLNFNLIKQLKNNRTLTLKVTNLLDDARESQFIGFNDESEYFSLRNIGRTFSLSYAVQF